MMKDGESRGAHTAACTLHADGWLGAWAAKKKEMRACWRGSSMAAVAQPGTLRRVERPQQRLLGRQIGWCMIRGIHTEGCRGLSLQGKRSQRSNNDAPLLGS
jgi:hypothetical protein